MNYPGVLFLLGRLQLALAFALLVPASAACLGNIGPGFGLGRTDPDVCGAFGVSEALPGGHDDRRSQDLLINEARDVDQGKSE